MADITNLTIYLIAINAITFLIFGYDKKQSIEGGWRISEKNLLTLALVGGTAGAIMGQKFFRHKTQKTSFLMKFIIIMIIQLVLVAIYFPEIFS